MENASKALLLATGILLGILIISVAARMFSAASGVSKSYHSQESASEIAEFNSHFTKYVGATRGDDDIETQFATIHDIVTTANFAWNYNRKKALKMDINPILEPEGNEFIHIQICKLDYDSNAAGDVICTRFENLADETYQEFIKNGYYVSQSHPDQDNIITYEIEIAEYDQVGKVKTVKFYPSKYNNKLQQDAVTNKKSTINHSKETIKTINNTLSNITQNERDWKK